MSSNNHTSELKGDSQTQSFSEVPFILSAAAINCNFHGLSYQSMSDGNLHTGEIKPEDLGLEDYAAAAVQARKVSMIRCSCLSLDWLNDHMNWIEFNSFHTSKTEGFVLGQNPDASNLLRSLLLEFAGSDW